MKNTVSVIIPVYNVEKYLQRCVNSVLNQTYTDLEIILVDDGATDSSGALCDFLATLDERVKVYHKENGGLSDARNYGIEKANGEYLTFIDSDDYVENDYVETLVGDMEKHGVDIAIGGHRVVYDTRNIEKTDACEQVVLDKKQALERMLYDTISIAAWSKLFRRAVLGDIRFPVGRLYEDTATTYKFVLRADKISYTSKAIYNYAIRTDSITRKEYSAKKNDIIKSSQEMSDACLSAYPDLERACNRKMVWAHLSVLSQIADSKNKFKKERKELIAFIKDHGKSLLSDEKTPKRDKIAIRCLALGFSFYKLAWKAYVKLGKRK